MSDSVFDEKRCPSKVAATLMARRIEELRHESAEAKLLRAFQLYELGQEIRKIRDVRSARKRRSTPERS